MCTDNEMTKKMFSFIRQCKELSNMADLALRGGQSPMPAPMPA